MSDKIQKSTHFKDLIDTKHIIAENDRLPGPDGTPGAGLKVIEAVPLAELWWDRQGRLSMPDFGKDPHEQVIRSGVMMGLPWFNLDKQERLRVLAQWYVHIGIPTMLEDRSTSDDGNSVDMIDTIRETNKEIFDVLDTECTHSTVTDAVEQQEWKEDYEALEREETLVNADGSKMERTNHGEEENQSTKA